MDVSRYFYNSKYISAGPESNKYKAWWVSQMYGRLYQLKVHIPPTVDI